MRKSKKIISALLAAAASAALAVAGSAANEASGGIGDHLPIIAVTAIAAVAAIAIVSMVASNNKKKAKAAKVKAKAAEKAAEENKASAVVKPAPEVKAEPVAEKIKNDDAFEVETVEDSEPEVKYEAPVKLESVEVTLEVEENVIEIPVVDVEDKTAPVQTEEVKTEVKVFETEAIIVEEKDSDLKEGEFCDPETGCIYTYDEKGIPVAPEGMIIRYKWSFLGRLIQSDNTVKYRYMMLRRLLLSYKKVRSSVSWNFDSYFLGRKPIAKIKIRGKHVVVYFNLDPATMAGTKYAGEDASKIARYKTVPFAYKVNGDRKLQYAMELVRMVMEDAPSVEPSFIEPGQAKYAIPTESFETLFAGGYIKIGGFLAVNRASSVSDDDDDEGEGINDASDNEEDSAVIDENVMPIEKEEFGYTPSKKD